MSMIQSIKFPEKEEEGLGLENREIYTGTHSGKPMLMFVEGDHCLIIFDDKEFVTHQRLYCENRFGPLKKVTGRVKIIID